MPKKKPYFPNYADQLRNAPDDVIRDIDGDLLPFDDFMDAKFGGALLPPGILCMIREHKANGKIKEHVYQRRYAANQKIKRMIYDGHEFSIVDREGCQHVVPTIPEYDDPLA